eukprot:scaffold350_cov333-Pavlova_lutheri.AAC.2
MLEGSTRKRPETLSVTRSKLWSSVPVATIRAASSTSSSKGMRWVLSTSSLPELSGPPAKTRTDSAVLNATLDLATLFSLVVRVFRKSFARSESGSKSSA